MNKRNYPVFSIFLFILSVLLAAYAAWGLVHSYRYVSEAASAGQLVAKGNEFEIASFYMTNGVQYFIFAVLLFSAGWLARKPLPAAAAPAASAASSVSRKEEDEQLDDWFEELRNNE